MAISKTHGTKPSEMSSDDMKITINTQKFTQMVTVEQNLKKKRNTSKMDLLELTKLINGTKVKKSVKQ